MNKHFPILAVACFVLAACSPSAEEIKTILNAHIAGLGEEGSTSVTSVEQTEKNIFSGTYSVSKDTLVAYVYPFTAIIKKDQITQFFKDTDETKVKVVNKQTGTEETKVEYDERIKKEEEERIAAEKAKKAAAARSSGSGMVSRGASYIISKMRSPSHAHVNYYYDAATMRRTFRDSYDYEYPSYLDAILYNVEAMNGYGGYNTESYVVFFKNGNPVTWLSSNSVTPAAWKRSVLPTLQYSGWK